MQQLQDALDAATNEPLCNELDAAASSDTTLAESGLNDCAVRVDLLENEPANNKQAFLAHVETCDAFTHWDITLLGQAGVGQPPMRFESKDAPINENLSGIGFSIYAGEKLIAQGEVDAGGVFETTGTTSDSTADTTVEATVDTGTITCKAIVTSSGASFDCARELEVYFFYFLAGGNESGSAWGNQNTVFGPIENVRDIYLSINSGGVNLLAQFFDPGTYEFQVPEVVPVPVPESNTQQTGPLPIWDGSYTPAALTTNFTISVLDGVEVWVELVAPCDTQTIVATIVIDGESIPFDEIPGFALEPGLCGVGFFSQQGLDAGDYEVSVNLENLDEILWAAQVESISWLSGPESYSNQVSPSDVKYTLTTQQVDASQTFAIEVPAGGLWFTARGNTNQACSNDLRIDPLLLLLDAQNSVIGSDDGGAELQHSNCYAALIETRLDEGTYYLVATTYDIQNPSEAWPDALTQYELVYGLETSKTITSPADLAEAITPSADAPAIVLPTDEHKLPVESIVVDGSTQANSGMPVIPLGVTSMLCTGDCILTLFENAGIDAVSIELSAGGESVVVTRNSRKVRVPVARGVTSISAIAKSADGAIVAETSSQVHQMSVKEAAMMSNTKSTTIKPSASKSVGSQKNGLYVLFGFVLISVLAVINSRRKGAVTKG